KLWATLQDSLVRFRAGSVTTPTGETVATEGQTITVVLPIALRMEEWGSNWGWNTNKMTNPFIIVDKVTLTLGATPAVYLSGPSGSIYPIGPLGDKDAKQLQELVAKMDPSLFHKERPLALKDPGIHLAVGLTVPDIVEVPSARMAVRAPDEATEEARYFPDLSVVRQIDERDAKSFTDGQRLLRLSAAGVLEYRTVSTSGFAPELKRAKDDIEDWMNTHGGWPQDLILTHYKQQSGRAANLTFELRSNGPYPVESLNGAIRVEVTGNRVDPGADSVTYFKRFPDTTAFAFGDTSYPVITPEEALKKAQAAYESVFAQDSVREVHMAYQIGSDDGKLSWWLEPSWVIKVGESTIYVPAPRQSDRTPRMAE
ncbi:MAG: hypothetical protein ACM3XM_15305, partial [Mycobacterium leprae]